MEGRLEGLAWPAASKGLHPETTLDLRLQVCRPVDRRVRVKKVDRWWQFRSVRGLPGEGSLSGSVVVSGCRVLRLRGRLRD